SPLAPVPRLLADRAGDVLPVGALVAGHPDTDRSGGPARDAVRGRRATSTTESASAAGLYPDSAPADENSRPVRVRPPPGPASGDLSALGRAGTVERSEMDRRAIGGLFLLRFKPADEKELTTKLQEDKQKDVDETSFCVSVAQFQF